MLPPRLRDEAVFDVFPEFPVLSKINLNAHLAPVFIGNELYPGHVLLVVEIVASPQRNPTLPSLLFRLCCARVPKLPTKSAPKTGQPVAPAELLIAIETFLTNCRAPAVLEHGEEAIPLRTGEYSLENRAGKVSIEVWTESRSISRRILSVDRHSTGVLDCSVHRFGGKPGKLSFLDLERPQSAHRFQSGMRQSFAEQFRRMLFRHFPGWEIAALSSSLDLQHSFSSIFPRACLVRGNQQIAALACPSPREEHALLTFALIWFHHLRTRSRTGMHTSLVLLLPDTAGNLTAHRLRWLTGESLQTRLFRFNAHGSAGEVDPCDLGNLDTRLKSTSCHTERVAFAPPDRAPFAPGDSSERRLEALVRGRPELIDPCLLPRPVHGQVLTFAAADRDLIDLLAVSALGRLAVIELKASEDIHLPLQALDYWMRIRWHAQRNQLQALFRGLPLSDQAPKLFLVAPAMSFHSSNASILRYFSPEIEVERVGINADWQANLRVVMRLAGADAPISHGVSIHEY